MNTFSTGIFNLREAASQANHLSPNENREVRVRKGAEKYGALKLARAVRHLLPGGITVFLLALMISTGHAQRTTPGGDTSIAGSVNPGSTAYSLACQRGEAVAGLSGRGGQYVDRIEVHCVKIDKGKWVGGLIKRNAAGGPGGQPFETFCPRDYVVSGYKGRAGLYIDRLVLQCKRLDYDPAQPYVVKTKGTPIDLQAVGGNGGQSVGPINCPDNAPATVLWGTSGQWIDSFGLRCRP